jgi:hypothetical protein
MGQITNAYKILVRKPEQERPLVRSRFVSYGEEILKLTLKD